MAEAWVLRQLERVEVTDWECDLVRSSLVDWPEQRERVQSFDVHWSGLEPPLELCPPSGPEAPKWGGAWTTVAPVAEGWAWGAQFVLGLAEEAADECPLGVLAVAALLLICSSDCGDGALGQAVEAMWRGILTPPPLSGRERMPPFLLSSTSWPVARLLTKWGLACSRRAPWALNCSRRPARFLEAMRASASTSLLPGLKRTAEPPLQMIYDERVDRFLKSSLVGLGGLRRGRELFACPLADASHEALLVLARFMGGPVMPQRNDPMLCSGGARLASALLSVPLAALLRGGWQALAALAGAQYATWRSHRLFPGSQVTVADVRHVLAATVRELPPLPVPELESAAEPGPEGRVGPVFGLGIVERARVSEASQRELWRRLASPNGQRPAVGSLWRRAARWLLEAPEGTPPVVCLSMAWGGLSWVTAYLRRALQVGVARLAFVTPDMLHACSEVAAGSPERWRLLCVRVSSHVFGQPARPYDINNYAKFFMLPLFLALGVDVVWLDIDIFLFKDPVPRLLRQAYGLDGLGEADVLTTDHFDHWHLNHGVFFLRASDRTLVWAVKYIEWLHANPVTHDQNGWDAHLKHTVHLETMVSVGIHELVTYRVLNTAYEYITLSGWAGTARTAWLIQLLHFTGEGGSMREKIRGPNSLVRLFNATAVRIGEDPVLARLREKRAVTRVLRRIQRPRPKNRDFGYEGIHAYAFGDAWNWEDYHNLFA